MFQRETAEREQGMSTQGRAQFTPGPTCTCEIVMRTGETLDSSLGNRPCSDISRILLCPFHTAAPAMYEALQDIESYTELGLNSDEPKHWEASLQDILGIVRDALAQAEGRQA